MMREPRPWWAKRTGGVNAAIVAGLAASIVWGSVAGGAGSQMALPVPAVRYLGQTPPGLTPARFAPGVVSTPGLEINGVFRPDFQEFVFARLIDGAFTLVHSMLDADRWSGPQPLEVFPSGDRGSAADMSFSPDGRELYFLGRYGPGVLPMGAPLDIWVTRRRERAWSTAELVPAPVSTEATESYPSVVADGSLYFASDRPGGLGRSDIYRAGKRMGGGFDVPVNVGRPISSADTEGDAFVSPDERYLIIAANRASGFGQLDLYVAFRSADGRWGVPMNLGDAINTPDTEFCPSVTPDGRYLFFSRMYGDALDASADADVFWVDIAAVERLRP